MAAALSRTSWGAKDESVRVAAIVRKEAIMKARKSFMRFIHVNSSWGLLALALALAGPAQGADPILIGQWPGGPRGWKAIGVAVDDHYAYVAGSDLSGLQVFDVSNPAHPRWLSDCVPSKSVFGVAVSGGYAYAACYNAVCR